MTATEPRWGVLKQIAQLLVDKRVKDFIIAPGSRSAPLTIALAQHSELTCRVVYDERSAGYIALGLAQQSGQPTGLVCTSGTAALNFGPAIAEAYYQQVPLLVLTADRSPEWIDQQDNQAIHQRGLYEPHCCGSYELPVDYAHPDAQWHALRTISEAIERARGQAPGPVHINVPLREPLYPPPPSPSIPGAASTDESAHPYPKRIDVLPTLPRLAPEAWDQVRAAWDSAGPKLIVVGMHRPDPQLCGALAQLGQRPDVAVVADITANLFPHGTPLCRWDAVLGTRSQSTLAALRPDLVISAGGPVVSKALRQLLRSRPPQAHWHVHPSGEAPDTFQSLTAVAAMRPADFFADLAERLTTADLRVTSAYAARWRELERTAAARVDNFLETAPFGEFQAMFRVLQALPAGSRLQIGNSMAIRYANFIAHVSHLALDRVDSNRGVSGIDGTVSTAVGAALATDRLTTLLVGDLAFFYDRNGLWHRHVPANLRIVVLNNHGGGIFDIIDGPDRLPRALQETYFLTPQPLTAQRTAADHGLAYFHAAGAVELAAVLPAFFAPHGRAAILEIESDMAVNSQVFRNFKEMLASLP
jgi:2-succinyl-5-enolpyruvyl-6-hydroxy-3-cyclohexene-1-carboxylate synthase